MQNPIISIMTFASTVTKHVQSDVVLELLLRVLTMVHNIFELIPINCKDFNKKNA
jgi:hypothetical protein